MNIKLIKEVYEEALIGTYNPQKLEDAFRELVDHDQPVNVRTKKQAVFAYMNYIYVEGSELPENPVDTHIVTEKPEEDLDGLIKIIEGESKTTVITPPKEKTKSSEKKIPLSGKKKKEDAEKLKEIIKLEQPKSTRKKTVTKVKK